MSLMCAARAAPESDAGTKAELDSVEVMRTHLGQDGLWNFLDAARSEGWSVPWIHSDYWVGRLPEKPEGRVSLERAKRAFGLALAKALDGEALTLMKPADSAARESQAKRLLDAADWIRTSRGYGNLLLVTRAENLAHIPIGHLVADLNHPTNAINALMKRVNTPDEGLGFRLAVLDEESPVPIYAVRRGTVSEVSDRLDLAWSRKVKTVAAWCKANGVRFSEAWKHRARMPPECAFFADDEVSTPPYTTVNQWDEKQHKSYCVYGGVTGIRQRVEMLYRFRLHVRAFPTTPPPWFGPQEKIYTATEAAFDKAWEPFGRTYGPIWQSAARTYESIRSNRLMDWETAQIVEALEKSKSPSK
ncbi:MAG: hypothetical protein FJ221_12975 [Lentisphaerae bacterium]|nr:hypothetical protein [Lentisphaerota bacterium]